MSGARSSYFLPRLFVILLGTTFLIVDHNYTYQEPVKYVDGKNKSANLKIANDFIPPFINIVTDLFVAPEYKIAACGIRKSMSQLTINIMCLLYDTEAFKMRKQSLNDTWLTQKACETKDHEFSTTTNAIQTNITKIAFIRDPSDRFISFYMDKCIREKGCWECKEDLYCIVGTLYNSLKRFKLNKDVKPTYIEMHAAPLSWNCDFNTQMSDYYLLKMGAKREERDHSISQLETILKSNNVSSELIDTIVEGSLNGETVHGTHKSTKRLQIEKTVRNDPVIRDYLHKIYFYDYIIFNFNRQVLDEEYQIDFWEKRKI